MAKKVSDQWVSLTQNQFERVDDAFLRDFRSPGTRNKFVAWDPFEASARYFKSLLFAIAARQSPRFFDAYSRLAHRDLGAPMTVRCMGCDVDADYLAAVDEWEFLDDTKYLQRVHSVVEIGAGFGRTCHTLLTLCPWIRSYTIIDLAPMLELSRGYLSRVMPDAPVRFVSSEDEKAVEMLSADLAINIDSFQEMPPDVITGYMRSVVSRAGAFYCKNPIGKYLPTSIGLTNPDPSKLLDVFSLGYCREQIDIFDDAQLARLRPQYVVAYTPQLDVVGKTFAPIADKPMELFPFYQHVLFAANV